MDVITIRDLKKVYSSGQIALDDIQLTIKKGEIFALLGPNGAGKTTLISTVCGIVRPTSGHISAGGHDILKDYRKARQKIGLVPQELTTDMFEKVNDTVVFSRHLFGKKSDPSLIEKILKDLSLWEKRQSRILTLSGGMKRRLMIAKALAHEPDILFLDEPTAGVDVELRRDMWAMVRRLRDKGVTIILTTHYIEEAEEMADRIGVINKGKLVLVEEKNELMKKLGKKQLMIKLSSPLHTPLDEFGLVVSQDKMELLYTYDSKAEETGIGPLLHYLANKKIEIKDLRTKESTLEEIFVELVGRKS